MYKLKEVQLTSVDKLTTPVEHRTTFTTNQCEFNIFETHQHAEQVRLQFGGFAITSMLRGKKVLHQDKVALDYIPGQTYLLSSQEEMVIDFPEACESAPTQCTALVMDDQYLAKQIQYLNEYFPREKELNEHWSFDVKNLFIQNDESIVTLGNRLVKIFTGSDPLKDVMVDLKLKELMLAIIRQQNVLALSGEVKEQRMNERLLAVVEYIRRNATEEINIQQLSSMAYMSKSSFYRMFTQEFGISPNKMVLMEKVNIARQMIASGSLAIKEVGYASGFSDPNYFSRVFKKLVGMTPMEYKLSIFAS